MTRIRSELMRKIQVYLREDQKAALKLVSAQTGARQSDLVQQGVDLVLQGAARQARDSREATQAAAGLWRYREDLDETVNGIRESMQRRFQGSDRRDPAIRGVAAIPRPV